MWATSPTYAVIIAYLSWMVFCWIKIWSCGSACGKTHPALAVLFLTVQRVCLVIFAFVGMHLLDIVLRLCFLDLIGYGSFSYIAAPVIFCVFLGVLYIVRCAFTAPAWTTLLAFGGMAGVYLWMSAFAASPRLSAALHAGVSLTVLLTLVDALWRRAVRARRENGGGVLSPPIWDISPLMGRVTGARGCTAVLLLLSVELVLQFEGLSLLCWL